VGAVILISIAIGAGLLILFLVSCFTGAKW